MLFHGTLLIVAGEQNTPYRQALRYSLLHRGALAQLGERLPCTQEVSGSIPLGSTNYIAEEYPSPAEGIGLENRQAG
jgi:hypothetical protein